MKPILTAIIVMAYCFASFYFGRVIGVTDAKPLGKGIGRLVGGCGGWNAHHVSGVTMRKPGPGDGLTERQYMRRPIHITDVECLERQLK